MTTQPDDPLVVRLSDSVTIIRGNCLDVLPTLSDVDAIVTDPPYGLSFMGKDWDHGVPGAHFWIEALRVAKPGAYLLAFGGTRTFHRLACAIEDAGFEIRDMIAWVYGSGFPKSLNVGKSVNQLETNEWSKIGKALDNIDQKSIMDVWKTNAKPAGIQLSKSLTEVGSNTPKKFFVPDIAVLFTNQKNEPLNAIIAELKSCGLNPISEESIIIVQESAEQKTELSPSHARYAVKLSQSQKAKHFNIFTAQCNVKEWLKENIMVNHRADEALKTLRGNKKYSNEEITNVLCAVLTDILKLTILNQSKTFQNLDTNQKTECASAINVIITEYTAENLISNTVDILKGKVFDKLQGNKREEIGEKKLWGHNAGSGASSFFKNQYEGQTGITRVVPLTKGTSEWEGWGTALKPALEPITVARKPIEKGLTIAENCLKWGVGGINIDACRITTVEKLERALGKSTTSESGWKSSNRSAIAGKDGGRWPANILHDGSEEVLELFPQSNTTRIDKPSDCSVEGSTSFESMRGNRPARGYDEQGSAARFFYCAKASKADRDEGCEGIEAKKSGMSNGAQIHGEGYDKGQDIGLNRVISRHNNHPTVKPTALMRYLCRLVTPPGGTILDPFMGSGSTGKAALREGFRFIGIERDADSFAVARARLENELRQGLLPLSFKEPVK